MRTARTVMCWLLGLFFVFAGAAHFARPEKYVRIVPPNLPSPLAIVYVSGVAEVVLGALLLVPRVRAVAAWGIVLLLVAVFPANVNMAVNAGRFPEYPPALLWARLPMQAVLIAWAYWFTRRPSS